MNMRTFLGRFTLVGALITAASSGLAQQVSVPLQSLLSREEVKINVTTTTPFSVGRDTVSMFNNQITVVLTEHDFSPVAGPAPPAFYVPVTNGQVILGRLPQGSYSVEVLSRNQSTSANTLVGRAQFNVADDTVAASSAYPAYNYTDLWWNSNESGWGISIHVKRDKFFAAWFVYDASGNPTWYTLQGGRWETATRYSGPIYITHAAPNSGVGPLSSLTIRSVGFGVVTFNGTDQAVFTYDINGISGNKSIVRQPF